MDRRFFIKSVAAVLSGVTVALPVRRRLLSAPPSAGAEGWGGFQPETITLLAGLFAAEIYGPEPHYNGGPEAARKRGRLFTVQREADYRGYRRIPLVFAFYCADQMWGWNRGAGSLIPSELRELEGRQQLPEEPRFYGEHFATYNDKNGPDAHQDFVVGFCRDEDSDPIAYLPAPGPAWQGGQGAYLGGKFHQYPRRIRGLAKGDTIVLYEIAEQDAELLRERVRVKPGSLELRLD